MDLIALLHLAWRITRTQPALWALHALLLVVGLPTVLISGAFGALGTAQELDPALLPTPAPQFLPDSDPATLALGWLIGLALILAFAPTFVLLIDAAARNATPDLGTFLPTIVCSALYLPVLWVLSGVLTTWTTTAWTVAFRRLTGVATAPVAIAQ